MIATLQKIGLSIGVSKQAAMKYIKKGRLRKNNKGKIDVEDPYNKEFLESKNADFSVFGLKNTPKPNKKQQKTIEKEEKRVKIEYNDSIPAPKDLNPLVKLDLKLKLENIKAKERDSELKKLRIEEARGKLIPRDLAEKYVTDTIGQFSQTLVSAPFALVDQILSIALTDSESKREDIIALLQKKYTSEIKKAAETGYKKYMRQLKERLQEVERSGEDKPRD